MSLVIGLAAAWAQAPSAGWKLVETEHFRVHYPEAAEAWALEAASRMEAIRTVVAEEVGWTPGFQVQVVVGDPWATANGAVYVLGSSPRMVLWTSPPPADSGIGHFRDPFEDLVLHEDTHVVHLMRPPRNFGGVLMQELFGLPPVLRKSPRWVSEGYATLVEGELTGSGRPHADFRAALLRRLAQQGQLPGYYELSASERWSGMSYAYFVGSAYLEWLEARAGQGSLQDLWARMSSRHPRGFDMAFEGVFGGSPRELYQRFCAELTAAAMDGDGAWPDRSTLWMDASWSTGRPALSPDGTKLAVIQRFAVPPGRLTVWEVAPDAEAITRREERIAEILAKDPEDVGPVPEDHPPHQVELSFAHRTHPPDNPRWLGDDRLLVDAPGFDAEGRVHHDLYVIEVESGRMRRVTRGADVHTADPLPGGEAAVAVRSRWGVTEIVRVDLGTGEVTPLTEPSVTEIVDQPRVGPDGDRLVWLAHRDGRFRPVVRDLAGGPIAEIPMPDGAIALHVGWTRDGRVLATLGIAGRLDVWELSVDGGPPVRRTSSGAALAPEPGPEGLFYLEMQADGLEVHHLPADAPEVPAPSADLGLAGRAVPVDPPLLPVVAVEPRAWRGLGRIEARPVVGGMVGHRGANFELGLRLGDVVGRNELVAVGSLGDAGGASGGGFWFVNRTLPFDVEVRGWALQDRFVPPLFVGGSATAAFDVKGGVGRTAGSGGVWAEQGLSARDVEPVARGSAFGSVGLSLIEPTGRAFWVRTGAKGAVGWGPDGRTGLGELSGGFTIGRDWALTSDYALGLASGAPFTLGGVTSAIRAEPAQWTALRVGWAAPDTAQGTVHDGMSLGIGRQGIELFGERRRLWGPTGPAAYTFVGGRVQQSADAFSLLKIPGLDVEMGAGCELEAVALKEKPCQRLEHYRAWTSVVWRP